LQEAGGTAVDRAVQFLVRRRFSRGGLGTSFAWSDCERGGRPGDENAWLTFREKELPKIIKRAQGVEVTDDPCWWTVWESREKIRRLIYADPLCAPPHNGSYVAQAVMWPSCSLPSLKAVPPSFLRYIIS
jgi:hypothetical protein